MYGTARQLSFWGGLDGGASTGWRLPSTAEQLTIFVRTGPERFDIHPDFPGIRLPTNVGLWTSTAEPLGGNSDRLRWVVFAGATPFEGPVTVKVATKDGSSYHAWFVLGPE